MILALYLTTQIPSAVFIALFLQIDGPDLGQFEASSRRFRTGLRHSSWSRSIFDFNYAQLQRVMENDRQQESTQGPSALPAPSMKRYTAPSDFNPGDTLHFDSFATILPGTRFAIQLGAGW